MTEPLQEELRALRTAVERIGELSPPPAPPPDQLDPDPSRDLVGQRVLVVGSDAGRRALAFAARGAEQVLACEPVGARSERGDHAAPESVDLRGDWESLNPRRDGTFELVHCDDLLHRVLEPIALLRRLRAMTADGGTLVIGSMLLADPERSELLRFVPDRHAGDPSWWFVPGRLAFRWMVMTAGFEVQAELDEGEGPRDGFAVVHGYLRATPTGLAPAAHGD